jgi:branched-chain amino acid transport system permease protein
VAQLLVSGLAMGCIYALIALGFNLLYNAAGVMNFAQGDLVMLGAYLGVTAGVLLGWPPLAVFAVTLAGAALAGYLYQLAVYRPFRDRAPTLFLTASVAVGIALRNAALIVWGPNPAGLPSPVGTRFVHIGGAALTPQHLFIAATTALLVTLQYLLLMKTGLGRRLRATAQDPEAARLMGIRVRHMVTLTFVLSAVFSGIAGVLLVPIFFATPDMGPALLLKAFIAIVIGGFGSIPGAIVGGLCLGLLEILIAAFVSTAYKDAIAFLVLILFLLAMPRGIFGERIAERV